VRTTLCAWPQYHACQLPERQVAEPGEAGTIPRVIGLAAIIAGTVLVAHFTAETCRAYQYERLATAFGVQ
jgi:hypothetical protein